MKDPEVKKVGKQSRADFTLADPVKSAAALLGRKGGLVKSAAKAKAAAENGKKGGRPQKKE